MRSAATLVCLVLAAAARAQLEGGEDHAVAHVGVSFFSFSRTRGISEVFSGLSVVVEPKIAKSENATRPCPHNHMPAFSRLCQAMSAYHCTCRLVVNG
jgi:hypothetical protein